MSNSHIDIYAGFLSHLAFPFDLRELHAYGLQLTTFLATLSLIT